MFQDEILNSIKEIIKDQEVYLVGGYLRNYFLNNEISSDRDLVTTGNAQKLAQEIAHKLNGTFIELDNENKIYRVVLVDKENYFDISQALNNDITEDVKRRDFTINSIFYDLNKKEIFDPLNGVKDIKNKILRTVDFKNLDDDPLRFLRLYRFMAKTGFKVENELKKYVQNNFSLYKNCAIERINYEIIKIFEGKYVVQTLLEMFEDEILELVFPFISKIKKIPSNSHHHLDLVHHSIETVNKIETNNPILKIAAFYHDIGKPATWTIEENNRHRFIGHDIKGAEIAKDELLKLNFSNKQIDYILKMIRYHIYPSSLMNSSDNNKAFARFVKKIGEDVPDLIKLAKADRLSALGEAVTKEMVEKNLSHLENLLNYYESVKNIVQNPKSLLNGNEIMQILNIKPSKLLGEIIDELIEMQLSGEIKTKEEANEFVIKKYKQ